MRFLVLLMLLVGIIACAKMPVTPTSTSVVAADVSTETALPTATIDSEPIALDADAMTAVVTPVGVISAETPHPTFTPFLEPTVTIAPTPSIKMRRPSIKRVGVALAQLPLDVMGDAGGFGIAPTLEFVDLNGDGEEDLIASDNLLVAVFLWLGNGYVLQHIERGSGKYSPNTGYQLADWTGDGVPELLFNSKSDNGGTGYYEYLRERTVIHCRANRCERVFNEPRISHQREVNVGGVARYTTVSQLDLASESPQLIVQQRGFTFYLDGYYTEDADEREVGTLNIQTETDFVYAWSGQTFELKDETIVAPAQRITMTSQLSATSQIANVATISVTKLAENVFTNRNDRCQLFVNGIAIGASLGCKRDFAQVSWQNVAGHPREELVVRVWSCGFHPNGEVIVEGSYCPLEQVVIYQLVDTRLVEIANETSCLLLPEVVQIKLVDLELDGELELIRPKRQFDKQCTAAQLAIEAKRGWTTCWLEETMVFDLFKWNGERFVIDQTDLLPSEFVMPSAIDQLLHQFPLAVGMSRVYSVTYETVIPEGEAQVKPAIWRGLVQEKIVEMHEEQGRQIFTAVLDQLPDGWGVEGVNLEREQTVEYEVSALGIRRDGQWLIQSPLEDGQSFAVFADQYKTDAPCWYGYCVNALNDGKQIPSGWYSNCYGLTMYTGPDTTMRTICDGVGVVEWISWRHGSPDNYVWQLLRIDGY